MILVDMLHIICITKRCILFKILINPWKRYKTVAHSVHKSFPVTMNHSLWSLQLLIS